MVKDLKLKIIIKFFLLVLILIPKNEARANEVTEIFGLKLEGLCHEDGSGKYDKIMKELGYTYKVYPAIRARQFMLNNNACLFPVDMEHLTMSKPLIQSDPFVVIDVKIFSLNKKYTLADLPKLRVGIRHGLMYGPIVDNLQKKYKMESVNSLEQNILKLQSGRIDAIIEFELDVAEYAQQNPKQARLVSGDEKIDSLADALVCVKNKKNESLIKNFNQALMKNRKKIDKMLQSKYSILRDTVITNR